LLQDFFKQQRGKQRERAAPLRDDALRTPDRCFDKMPDCPWSAHYLADLPSLAGLRMHFVDEGPRDNASVYLCLHPIPGWSYCLCHGIGHWLGQGRRVLAPDLIGFGKSDKPKREDAHSLAFHCQYLLEWLERLDIQSATLVVPQADHPLAEALLRRAPERIRSLLVQTAITLPDGDTQTEALNAPFPDAGHRAAERAFASKRLQSTTMKI
jgi:tRNA(adenine34) deaminase